MHTISWVMRTIYEVKLANYVIYYIIETVQVKTVSLLELLWQISVTNNLKCWMLPKWNLEIVIEMLVSVFRTTTAESLQLLQCHYNCFVGHCSIQVIESGSKRRKYTLLPWDTDTVDELSPILVIHDGPLASITIIILLEVMERKLFLLSVTTNIPLIYKIHKQLQCKARTSIPWLSIVLNGLPY